MKFGKATTSLLLACALLRTGAAEHLRKLVLQDPTSGGSTSTTSGGSTSTTSGGSTSGGSSDGSTSGVLPNDPQPPNPQAPNPTNQQNMYNQQNRVPVQELRGHIGGGTFGEEGIHVLNNIGYAFVGYDVIKGNPLDTSGLVKVDLGYRNAIFEPVDYELMVDREYYAPANVDVLECQGCNMHATTRVLNSMSDYVHSLQSKVQAGASHTHGPVTGQFSGSLDYQTSNHLIENEHETSTESEISCCVYQAELKGYSLPPYSRNFLNAVDRLRAAADTEEAERKLVEAPPAQASHAELNVGTLEEEIERFVHEFGTHYIKKVTMGSLYGEQTFIDQESMRDIERDGIDVRSSASVSVATSSGSGGYGLDMDVAGTREFLEKTSRKSVYSRGAKPIGGGDADAWLAYSSDNPVPTYCEVMPIEDLGAYQNDRVVEALGNYIQTYCQRVPGANCDTMEVATEGGPAGLARSPQSVSYSPDQYQAGLGDSRTNPFLENENYATTALQVFIGIEGVYDAQEEESTYSAIVADLGASNTHATGPTVGWSEYSDSHSEADLTCGTNEAVIGIRSNIGWNGDREIGINCASIEGMTIRSTRLAPDGLSMIDAADADALPWNNEVGVSFTAECPLNHVLVGLKSVWNSALSDIRWKLRCALMIPASAGRRAGSVSITPQWNEIGDPFYYSSPNHAVLKGLLRDFNPTTDDSTFRFPEQWLGGDRKQGSSWSDTWELPSNPSDGDTAEFSCGGQALTGMMSNYNADATGLKRNYKFECSGVQNHRLIHASGQAADGNSQIDDADWSDDWVGRGSSFGLECEGSKILAGFKFIYEEADNDFGWKALCLGLTRN